jgi:hypothetical protein
MAWLTAFGWDTVGFGVVFGSMGCSDVFDAICDSGLGDFAASASFVADVGDSD